MPDHTSTPSAAAADHPESSPPEAEAAEVDAAGVDAADVDAEASEVDPSGAGASEADAAEQDAAEEQIAEYEASEPDAPEVAQHDVAVETDGEPEDAQTVDAEPVDAEPGDPSADAEAPSGVSRILAGLTRPRRGQAVVAVLLLLVGFGAVTQVRTNVDDTTYAGYREQDLIDLLDGLSSTSQRAQDQINQLTRTRQQLENDTSARQAALSQAQRETDSLQVLAGTVPVTGPGVIIHIDEQTGSVTVTSFLDLIEELRSNGAEALSVNGVRLVAQSSFEQVDGGLNVDGHTISSPYVVRAIGQPSTLAAAVTFTRGPGDELRGDGAVVSVDQQESLVIDAVVPSGGGAEEQ